MGGKVAIALGLVAGIVVGGLLVGGAIALMPPLASQPPLASAPAPMPTAPAPVDTPGPTAAPATGAPAPSDAAAPSPEGSPSAPGAITIGEPAPPLQLQAVGGDAVDLASLRGKPVWVSFMTSSCSPCRDELPLMPAFAARYEEAGLVVLLVDVGEDEAVVKAFLDELNVYLPTALDPDAAAQAAWGITTLPVHAWIDDEGIVREWSEGGLGPDAMATGLQTILPDETVTP